MASANIDDQEIAAEEVIESDDGDQSKSKRSKKGGRVSGGGGSAVWDHFSYSKIEKKSKCSYCDYSSSDKRSGNLALHLKSRHKEAYEDYVKKTSAKSIKSSTSSTTQSPPLQQSLTVQSKLFQFVGRNTRNYYNQNSSHNKKLLHALALFASNSLPHLLVEAPEFNHFLSLLDPRFKLPNRKRIAVEIRELHIKLKSIIRSEIEKAGQICLILDIWSRKGLSESYLGILVCYFDQSSSSIKQALIALSKMDGSHTADNINLTLQAVLLDWDISSDKILFYVTDSGSNIVKALKECVVEFVNTKQEDMNEDDELPVEKDRDERDQENAQGEGLLVGGASPYYVPVGDWRIEEEDGEDVIINEDLVEFENLERDSNYIFGYSKRIPCAAHKIMCIVRKCFDSSKSLQPIIKSAMKLVKAFTKSGSNKELLLKYNNNRGLLSPSQTRWVYTYYILDRLLESKEAVEKVVNEKELFSVALGVEKWKKIEKIRNLLEPFAEIIKDLEGDQYSTINKVIPAIIHLINILADAGGGTSDIDLVSRNLKEETECKFASILDCARADFQPTHMIATFFDPDFMIGLKPDQRNACIKIIIQDILSRKAQGARQENVESTDDSSTLSNASSTAHKKYGRFFDQMRDTLQLSPEQIDQSKILQTKLETYVQEVLSGGQQSSNAAEVTVCPVQFWAGKLSTFGEIAIYALHILMVPASSAGIERAFSLASIVQGNRRYRLSASSTEKELMIKINRKYLM